MCPDPSSPQSYGVIANNIINSLRPNYEWHVIVNERSHGPPKDIRGMYWEWAGGVNRLTRNTTVMPHVVDKVQPEFILTIDDLDNVGRIDAYKDVNLPWIQYFPIDNHDTTVLRNTSFGINNSDVSVCMSRFAYNFAKEHHIKIDECIYPFIDTDVYHKLTNPVEIAEIQEFKKLYMMEDKKVLLFVGRPGWRKNVEFLLGVFKKLLSKRDDICLFLHMDFNDPCREFNPWKSIYALDIPPNLITRFAGVNWDVGIPKKMMNLLYNVADVYISTHGGEGFGLPIAEAMSCETPGVITNCTTTPEFYKEGDEWVRGFGADVKANILDNNVLRPFVDLNDFVKKVDILLDDESLRKDMGKKGRQWILKNCSVPVISRQWKMLLRKIDVPKARVLGYE
jgi:glycosyltransferase involved in cell wall biosynthesis